MSQPVDIRPVDLEIVQNILHDALPRDVKVWVFGSRAKWTTKDSSDLDIAIDAGRALTRQEEARLADAFEESDLPYKVDFVDLNTVSPSFREIIERDKVPLPQAGRFGMRDWQETTLGEIADINLSAITAGQPDRMIRYVDISSVDVGTLNTPPAIMPLKNAPLRARRLVQYGDSVLSTVRPNRKSRFFVRHDLADAVVSTGFAVLRPKNKMTDARYLYSIICDENFVSYLIANEKGAAYPAVTTDIIERYPLALPPLPEQRAIAAVLGALDDKIELNRRMNATLESMARALFKSWFVDFDPIRAKMEGKQPQEARSATGATGSVLDFMDAATAALFPSRLVPSPFGDIPEGWEAGRLSDILELLYGKSLTKEDRQSGPYPVYGSGGVTGYNNQALVNGPGIVVGRKGTVGSLYWEDRNFFPIDTVFYVVPKQYFSLAYIFFQLECLGLENMNTDAAVPGLNRENAYRLDIVKPSQSILTTYTSIASEIRGKIRVNNSEIEKLEKTRDYLLPKLISGDIRIPDAEKFVEAA